MVRFLSFLFSFIFDKGDFYYRTILSSSFYFEKSLNINYGTPTANQKDKSYFKVTFSQGKLGEKSKSFSFTKIIKKNSFE